MKFVKKTKNLYFFRCDSIPELDELVAKQVIGEIKEKSHTSLLLSPRKDLDKLYETIVNDYRNRLINCKHVCVYVTDEFLDLNHSTAYLSRHR
jgi:6-phosphogluconolactonase/glucosamine-6-phosphate isomerase/deaminase